MKQPEQLELIREPSPAELRAFRGAAPLFEAIAPYAGSAEYARKHSLEAELQNLAELRTRYAELIIQQADALSAWDRSLSDDVTGTVAVALRLLFNQIAWTKGMVNAIQKRFN